MTRRFFDHDPLTQTTEFFHYDESTHKVTIETVTDDEAVIENNKRLANDGDGFLPSRDGRRIASIPPNVQLKWLTELGVDLMNKDHMPAVRRLLNDPDWRFLRTSPGRF